MNRMSEMQRTELSAPPCVVDPGDHSRWFNEEVHPHGAHLKSYLERFFPSIRDADDVVQESYLRIWKARAGKEIKSARAFLFSIARRLAIDIVRRDRRSPFTPVKDVSELFVSEGLPDASHVANRNLELKLLVDAIDSLPARCREIFVLCHVEGLSQREVANRLKIAEGTVAVQSSRGLQRCEEYVRSLLGNA